MSFHEYSEVLLCESLENSNFKAFEPEIIEDLSESSNEKILSPEISPEKSVRKSLTLSTKELNESKLRKLSVNNLNDMSMQFLSIQTRAEHQAKKKAQDLKVKISTFSAFFLFFASILIYIYYPSRPETSIDLQDKIESPIKIKIQECLPEDVFAIQKICMADEDFCKKFSQNSLTTTEKLDMIFEEYKGWTFNENKVGIKVSEIKSLANCKTMFTISEDGVRVWEMNTLKATLHSSNGVKLYEISHDEKFVIYSNGAGDIFKINLKTQKRDKISAFFFAKPLSRIVISDDSKLIVLMFENVKDVLVINSETLDRTQTFTEVAGKVRKVVIDGKNDDIIIQDSEGIKIYSLHSSLPGKVIKSYSELKKWRKEYFKLINFEST